MSLYKYASACNELQRELIAIAAAQDVTAIRMMCADVEGWQEWFLENEALIRKYLKATPSQRKNRKSWQEKDLRLKLILGSIQYLTCAHRLLEGIDRNDLYPGASYRDMAEAAAKTYLEVVAPFPWSIWPFEKPSPFE